MEAELLALFARGLDAPLPDAEFDRLARAVFAYQYERNRPYAHFCRARGRTPETVGHWSEIPSVPTAAFKVADLTTVAPEDARVVYLTSGTRLGTETRGRHLLPDTRLYDASLLPNIKAHLLPERERMRILVFGPSAEHFPHSSLGHMNSRALEAFGAPGSGLFWDGDGPRFEALAGALERAVAEGEPVCLLGTAFGFVHLLDWLAERGRDFALPPGSRIMDTGGYKGRSREVLKEELYRLYGERLGVPGTHVVNEYGMTELGSQFYDPVLRGWLLSGSDLSRVPEGRWKSAPPWVRVRAVDPDTLAPLPDGEPGLLRFHDLANLHSVIGVQTDDLGIMRGERVELLGRAPGAEPRGCSLAAEDLA